VIDRTRQHANELGLTQPAVHRTNLRLGVRDRGLVVLRRAEIEVVRRVVQILAELLDRLEQLLDLGALAQKRLRLLGSVPEVGGPCLLVQLREPFLESGDVKDAPLAQGSAF
jgi:DNA-binding transcriptional LysR family regulator